MDTQLLGKESFKYEYIVEIAMFKEPEFVPTLTYKLVYQEGHMLNNNSIN